MSWQESPSPSRGKTVSVALFPHSNSAYHKVSASGPRLGPQGFQAAIHHVSGVADGEYEAKKPESHVWANNLRSQIQFWFQISRLKDFHNSECISVQICPALKITDMSVTL